MCISAFSYYDPNLFLQNRLTWLMSQRTFIILLIFFVHPRFSNPRPSFLIPLHSFTRSLLLKLPPSPTVFPSNPSAYISVCVSPSPFSPSPTSFPSAPSCSPSMLSLIRHLSIHHFVFSAALYFHPSTQSGSLLSCRSCFFSTFHTSPGSSLPHTSSDPRPHTFLRFHSSFQRIIHTSFTLSSTISTSKLLLFHLLNVYLPIPRFLFFPQPTVNPQSSFWFYNYNLRAPFLFFFLHRLLSTVRLSL